MLSWNLKKIYIKSFGKVKIQLLKKKEQIKFCNNFYTMWNRS